MDGIGVGAPGSGAVRARLFGVAFLVAVAPIFATCDDSVTGPTGGEVVALTEVGGQPLPVTVEEAPGYFRTWRADTIHLGANDRWRRRMVQEWDTPDTEPRILDWTSDGTLEYTEGGIVLAFVCNDTASCVAPDRLIPDAQGYRIEREVSLDSVQVFRYSVVQGGGS